jgi:hypothetical protein
MLGNLLLKLADYLERQAQITHTKLNLPMRGRSLEKFKLYYEPLGGDKELEKWVKKTISR